ncbi:MAG: hypothetical protein JOZ69_24900 [Myxococcales bacterium]|nr:hypothetical protein [Myxococcales bacterium]
MFGGTPPDELGLPEEPLELEDPERDPDELPDPEELEPEGFDPDDELELELELAGPELLPAPPSGPALGGGVATKQPAGPIAARPSAPPSATPTFVHRGQAMRRRDVFIGCR